MKVLLALLALAAPAVADEVVLRNGSVFSGIVREEGDRVTIRMDYGTMTFRKIDVREVRKSDDPLKELETKTLAASTPKDYFELALWARDRGLQGRADELLQKVIFLDPDHEGARKALGYERHEGQWLKGDELMVARGFIKHEGKWLRRETVEQLLAQEHAEAVEYDRQKTIRQAAEMNREVALQKIELERERIEAELEIARRTRWWSSGTYYPAGPAYVLPPTAYAPGHHPGYGPGRTLPPVPDRLYPGGTPSVTPPFTTTTGGGPPITTNK
ncbi:MAG TPA: hypothetical protein VF950_07290 [Planctomycetota bacterium]